MKTSNLGILSKMAWNRYSFSKRKTLNDGILPNDLKQVLFKDTLKYNSSDVSKLLSLIGKCSCDSNLIYRTDWCNLYSLIYKSASNSTHIWNFHSLVKLLQNAAYLCDSLGSTPTAVSFLSDTVELVTKRLGKNINQVGDKDVSRIIYSCSKGDFLGNLLVSKSFLLLLENEIISHYWKLTLIDDLVIQRLSGFEAIDLLKILHSISSMKKHNEVMFEKDFISCVCNKILEKITRIGSIDISNLICFLHNNNLLNKSNTEIINNNINKRLYGIRDKNLLLSTSLSLVMYNIINLKNMELIIKLLKIHEFQAEDIIVCKLMIYYLKYNTKVYEELSDGDRNYLNTLSSTFINGISYGLFDHVNSNFATSVSGNRLNVNKELCKLLRMLNYNFIPFLYGPYLLNFYDPINRIAILTNTIGVGSVIAPNITIARISDSFNGSKGTYGTGNSSNSTTDSSNNSTGITINRNSNINNNINTNSNRSSWVCKNLMYFNENLKQHLRLEGLKLIELPEDFFYLNVYRQMRQLTDSINVLYKY